MEHGHARPRRGSRGPVGAQGPASGARCAIPGQGPWAGVRVRPVAGWRGRRPAGPRPCPGGV
eukprot:7113599-Lingulodinium_polyedra.AAC.1